MKCFRRLPWQVRFALAAPLLVLAILSAAQGGRMAYEWLNRRQIEQALASFDPETTEYTVSAGDWLNGIAHRERTPGQLTPRQRRLVGQWMASFRYEKPYGGEYTGAGPTLWIEFDSPRGSVFASGICYLHTGRNLPLPWLGYQYGARKALNAIEYEGISAASHGTGLVYRAEFDYDSRLHRQLWESLTGQRF